MQETLYQIDLRFALSSLHPGYIRRHAAHVSDGCKYDPFLYPVIRQM